VNPRRLDPSSSSSSFTSSSSSTPSSSTEASFSLPIISLGPGFTKISDYYTHFPSLPSLVDVDSLTVVGGSKHVMCVIFFFNFINFCLIFFFFINLFIYIFDRCCIWFWCGVTWTGCCFCLRW
jgi:hypothetical protein